MRGAILLLSVFHHNRIGSNDLCGVCVVPCEDIPFLSPVCSAFDNPNAIYKKNLMLPVFKVPPGIVALNEIRTRAQLFDQRAQKFLKENKQNLGIDKFPT